jgi:thiosulfate dehydrogenase
LFGDAGTGHKLFTDNCARCHGNDGTGSTRPALWARVLQHRRVDGSRRTSASFIRHNMPFDKPGLLTDQQSYDIAAYITSMPRPDQPGKETDWPTGGAPTDVPYDTRATKPSTRPVPAGEPGQRRRREPALRHPQVVVTGV